MVKNLIFHQVGWDCMYMVWHAAATNQIIYTYSTGGSIVLGDRIYPIQKGAMCFISSQCYHYTMPDKPEIYERSKIIISDDTLTEVKRVAQSSNCDDLFSSNSVIYALIPEDIQSEVERIYREASECAHFGMHADLYFVSCLLRLITYLDLYKLESIPSPIGFTAKTLDYINQHIGENLTVDVICSAIHMSKYHFCRRFKEAIGLTVMEYILQTRLTLAKNMLVKESTSITHISEDCGFSSVSYFCRVFKENTGMSPQMYRKKAIFQISKSD